MKVTLKHNTPLHIAAEAIRTCWASQGKSDSEETFDQIIIDGEPIYRVDCGPKDRELIERVGNKFKHASTLEHLTYNFKIEGISRAVLQELTRHRIASPSVKSTRYTLKELKDDTLFQGYEDKPYFWFINELQLSHMGTYLENILMVKASKYLRFTGDIYTDVSSLLALQNLQFVLRKGVANDISKYCLPEAYLTSLSWTINARSLQNFLSLRTSKAALWEIRELAQKLYDVLPEEHKYLFTNCLEENKPKIVEMDEEQYGAYMDWAMQNGFR